MILNRTKSRRTEKSYAKVVTEHTLNKAAKESIADQRILSEKAAKLRSQTTSH